MHYMFGESAYLFSIIKYFPFPFFCLFLLQRKFSSPVTSSNLRNQAPLFAELRLLQGTLSTKPFAAAIPAAK